MNQQNLFKQALPSFYVGFLIVFLTSCAAPNKPEKKTAPIVEIKPQPIQESELAYDLDYYLTQAQQGSEHTAIENLLAASQLLIQEKQFHKALWLANHIHAIATKPNNIYQSQLVKAHSLLSLGQLTPAEQQLAAAEKTANANKITHLINYHQLSYQIHTMAKKKVLALAAQMNLIAVNKQQSLSNLQVTWRRISRLTSWQLAQLKALKPAHVKGWSQLSNYARRFADNQGQFRRYLNQWQKQYPNHPAQLVVEELLATDPLLPTTKENIAVLLPLTGTQQKAGQAAQQGILAALAATPEKQVVFYDANSQDWQALPQQLLDDNIDFIIGPLLRNNVKSFLELEDIETPSLLLNILPRI